MHQKRTEVTYKKCRIRFFYVIFCRKMFFREFFFTFSGVQVQTGLNEWTSPSRPAREKIVLYLSWSQLPRSAHLTVLF